MNWRKSDRDLAALYQRNPWLYVIEWRERLERCVRHLQGVQRLDPQEVAWEAKQLRDVADELHGIADRWEREAAKRTRIDALRNVAGRTPAEAAAYLAKADALEAARTT